MSQHLDKASQHDPATRLRSPAAREGLRLMLEPLLARALEPSILASGLLPGDNKEHDA